MKATILGIDPGFDRVGWAVGSSSSAFDIKLLEYGCIQTNKKQDVFTRYKQIAAELKLIIQTHKPTELAIENLFFSKNTSTALRVSEARGIIIGTCLDSNTTVHEYNPNQIKQAVTGHGRATKTAMEKMVKLQFLLPKDEKIIDDAIDALGILLTHSVTRKTNSARQTS